MFKLIISRILIILSILTIGLSLSSCKQDELYNYNKIKGLSKAEQREIIDAFSKYRNCDIQEVSIVDYYGEYNGVYAIYLQINGEEFIYGDAEENIHGITFLHTHIISITMYYKGYFHSIEGVFGIIDMKDLLELYYYYYLAHQEYSQKIQEELYFNDKI